MIGTLLENEERSSLAGGGVGGVSRQPVRELEEEMCDKGNKIRMKQPRKESRPVGYDVSIR
jgi:hypothetical protein